MSHVPHEIADEFPEHKERIHQLKATDGHFVRLFDEYHRLNREIHRIEAAGINTSDEVYEMLKHQRLDLKDALYRMLTA